MNNLLQPVAGLLFCLVTMCTGAVFATETNAPILIGGTISLEGAYTEPSLMIQKAYKFWVDEVNGKGGLLGRPLKLILYDDKSDYDLTKELYKRLIKEDRVDLVLSPYSTPLTMAASEITEPARKLMLAVAAASEKPWKKETRYLFQLYAPADRQFIGLLDMLAKKRYRTLAVIYNDRSDFNTDIFKGIKEWAKIYKLDMVFVKPYQDGKKDLPAILEAVRDIRPDTLINSSYPPDSYELLGLLEKMKYRPAVLAMPIVPAYPFFYDKVGQMADRVLSPSQWEPEDRIHFPGTQRFITAFTTYAGHPPSFHAASAYAACQLTEAAVNRSRDLDHTKFRDYIASLNTVTVLGRFKVDPSGLQVGHNSFIIQWQNGKKEIVWPGKIRTAPPQL